MTLRAAKYERISKVPTGSMSATLHDGPTSYSVEDQDVRIEALVSAEKYDVVATFYDDGISAYRSLKDRPGYEDLRRAVAERSFDVLLFDRQDRLARDQSETLRFVADCRDQGIAWHSVQEGRIDLSDPLGVLIAVMRGGEADTYATKISINARVANEQKRNKGLPGAGQRPFGYGNACDHHEPTYERKCSDCQAIRLTTVPAEAELIKLGTAMARDGKTKAEILRVFKNSGVKTVRGKDWHAANVVALLKRWRNAGYVEHDDKPYGEAIWEPIVKLEDVEAVRIIFGSPKVPGQWKTPTALLSGLAKCTCGESMVVSGGDGKKLYRCVTQSTAGRGNASGHSSILTDALDTYVADFVAFYFIYLAQDSDTENEAVSELAALHEELDKVRKQKARLKDLYDDADSDLTLTEYKARSAKHAETESATIDKVRELTARNVTAAFLTGARSLLRTSEHGIAYLASADKESTLERANAQWRSMPLGDQRRLIAATFDVTVRPMAGNGRALAKRVEVSKRRRRYTE